MKAKKCKKGGAVLKKKPKGRCSIGGFGIDGENFRVAFPRLLSVLGKKNEK